MQSNSRDSAETVVEIVVPGMGSDHCAGIIKTTLKRLDGVKEITTNIASRKCQRC